MRKISIIACLVILASVNACAPGQLLGPTVTPTPTNTSTPTLTPTFTLTPTNTLTPTITPGPSGPCDNPLTPLGAGNQWTYLVTSGAKSARFNIGALNVENLGNVVSHVSFANLETGQKVTDLVICQDGAIVNYPLFVLNMLFFNYLDGYIDVYHEGIQYGSDDFSPSYASLLDQNWGMQWQSRYLTENGTNLHNPSGELDMFIPIDTHLSLAFSLNRVWEPLTVPAGDFQKTLKMDLNFTIPVTVTVVGSGAGSGAVLKVNTSQWYSPFVGLLRAEITSATLAEQIIPLDSVIELTEFSLGY